MKISELDKLDKMCVAIQYAMATQNQKHILLGADEFTEKDYQDCLMILAKERLRKAKVNDRTAKYIAEKRKTNPNYAR